LQVYGYKLRTLFRNPFWVPISLFALVAVALLEAIINPNKVPEIYYAAAARSMSQSWHNFFFASFDPAGTVSLDKLPAAFWIQAMSVKFFGSSYFSYDLPQSIEYAISSVSIYLGVAKITKPAFGFLAAGIFILTPAEVLVSRGNVADCLLILFLVMSANSFASYLNTSNPRHIYWASLFIGLGFNAKMMEAWLASLPLAICYLKADKNKFAVKMFVLIKSLILTICVSLSWMITVTLVSSRTKPYFDGSNNNIFSQTFLYNGLYRFIRVSPVSVLSKNLGVTFKIIEKPSILRLFTGPLGRIDAAVLVPAIVCAIFVLFNKKFSSICRIATLYWFIWILEYFLIFSFSTDIQPYYVSVMTVGCASVIGIWCSTGHLFRRKYGPFAFLLAAATFLCYCYYLIPGNDAGNSARWAIAILGVEVVVFVPAIGLKLLGPSWHRITLIVLIFTILMPNAVISYSAINEQLGPFDTPFGSNEQAAAISIEAANYNSQAEHKVIELILKNQKTEYLGAAYTSAVASTVIYLTGKEMLPIGGYSGEIKEPSLSQIKKLVSKNIVRTFIIPIHNRDPRLLWIYSNCKQTNSMFNILLDIDAPNLRAYKCG
jgi:4-amino-4-deoxy-L-arabinose transferase-like glycosyltransferase